MLYVLAFFLPPFAVLFAGYPGKFFLNCILSLCGFIPGIIHAITIVSDKKKQESDNRLAEQISKGVAIANSMKGNSSENNTTLFKAINSAIATSEGTKTDPYLEIEKMANLKEKGIISDEEFQAMKKKLLGI